MGRIKQFQCMVPDADGTQHQRAVYVYYDTGRDHFYIPLPSHMDASVRMAKTSSVNYNKAELMPAGGSGRVCGPSAAAVQKEFSERCHAYAQNARKARRVIMYVLKWAKAGGKDHFDMPFEYGSGLVVEFEVMWETRLGKEQVRYSWQNPIENPHLVNNSGPRLDENRCKVIDWTPEREEFFHSLDAKLKLLIDRSRHFLEDEKSLALLIDGGDGLKLLGFGGSVK